MHKKTSSKRSNYAYLFFYEPKSPADVPYGCGPYARCVIHGDTLLEAVRIFEMSESAGQHIVKVEQLF